MVVAWQLATPFDLVYEGPNLATIEGLRRGVNVYAPAFFNGYPFVFTLYTPLYHLICANLPAHSANPFLTGRLVALTFMGAAALGVLWAARPRNWAHVVLGLGPFLLLHPVVSNLAFLKNDGTALFFSVLALLTVSQPSRTSVRLALTALFCVLAVAAKQVYLAATAACFVYLFFDQRRDALRFGLYYLMFAAIGATAAQMVWGNGFWWCVFHAPRLPLDAKHFRVQWDLMLRQPVFALLLVCSLVTAAEYLWRGRGRQWVSNPFLLYFLFAGAVLLLTVGKPGSSTNYFIEPGLAAVLWLVSVFPSSWLGKAGKPVATGLCLAATVSELAIAKPLDFTFAHPSVIAQRAQFHNILIQEAGALISRTNELRVLNFAGANTFFDWPGETSLNDPYLYTLLWKQGVLKPDSMVRELRSQTYDLVVFWNDTVVGFGDRQDGLGRIVKALRESYRFAGKGAYVQYWVRIPPNGSR